MDLKLLRKRCESRLCALELPSPFSARTFCRSLAARRGRPITLRPVVSRVGPWGLWVAGPTADFIFYEQDTSPLHQEHIILHEASHLLCGHRADPVLAEELRALLFPDLGRETVESVLRRSRYSTDDEQEAELLASVILGQVAFRLPEVSPAGSPELAGLHHRLLTSLGGCSEA